MGLTRFIYFFMEARIPPVNQKTVVIFFPLKFKKGKNQAFEVTSFVFYTLCY